MTAPRATSALVRHILILVVAGGASPARAGEPCRIAAGDSAVGAACAKGGRDGARRLMKAQLTAAKSRGGAFTCDGCHRNLDDYQLTATGRDDYAKLLALLGPQPAATPAAVAPATRKPVAAAQKPVPPPAAPAAKAAPKPLPAPVAKVMVPAMVPAITEGEPVEGVRDYQLANGLRVLLAPDPTRATVTVTATYFVGARHEGTGEGGFARLLAGALSKGPLGHRDPWSILEEDGAHLVAEAAPDRTTYVLTVPATSVNLLRALQLEAGRLRDTHFERADLASDLASEDAVSDGRAALEEALLGAAFPRHGYGRPAAVDVARVQPEALQAFHATHYRPDNAIVVVAGKFEVATTVARVQDSLGAVPRPARALAAPVAEPAPDGERSVIVRRPGEAPLVAVGYRGLRGADPDFAAEEAAGQLLVERSTGRLAQALVTKGLADDLRAEIPALVDPGLVAVSARVRDAKAVDRVQATLASTVEGLARAHVRADELERWRSRVLKEAAFVAGDSERVGAALGAWAALGDWRLFYLHRDRVRALLPADVERVAGAYFKPANRTAAAFLPAKAVDRAPTPPVPDVAALVREHAFGPATTTVPPFAPTIDNVEDHTERTVLGSGLRLALLPKKTRGQTVTMALTLHFGSEADLAGRAAAAELLGPMLLRGSRQHDRQHLEDAFAALQAEVRVAQPASGAPPRPGQLSLTVTTVGDHLPAVVRLLGEVLRAPALAKGEWESVRREELARLAALRADPATIARLKNLQAIYPYARTDVRYVPTVDEALARIRDAKLTDVAWLHKNLLGASHAELAVVGDFDDAAVTRALDEAFGTWSSPRPWKRIERPFKPGRVVDELIDTPGEAEAVVAVAQGMDLGDQDPEYPAALLMNRVLGGGAGARLDERLGGATSELRVPAFDRSGAFFAAARCAPTGAVKTMDALLEELRRLATEEVGEAELARAKSEHAHAVGAVLENDEALAAALATELHLGRTLAWWKRVDDAVAAVTAADVKAAARKYLQPARLARVRTTDLKVARARETGALSAQEPR